MKLSFVVILLILLGACNPKNKIAESDEQLPDNPELAKMFEKDQSARQVEKIDWETLLVEDSLRQIRVSQLLDSNKVNTALDYYHAAMIYQHGLDTVASAMAVKLMKKSIELDSNADKWLLAAAIDRDLMRRNKPQIFGTQYVKMGKNAAWELYKLDSTKISDSVRREYNVKTLAEQRKTVNEMNEK